MCISPPAISCRFCPSVSVFHRPIFMFLPPPLSSLHAPSFTFPSSLRVLRSPLHVPARTFMPSFPCHLLLICFSHFSRFTFLASFSRLRFPSSSSTFTFRPSLSAFSPHSSPLPPLLSSLELLSPSLSLSLSHTHTHSLSLFPPYSRPRGLSLSLPSLQLNPPCSSAFTVSHPPEKNLPLHSFEKTPSPLSSCDADFFNDRCRRSAPLLPTHEKMRKVGSTTTLLTLECACQSRPDLNFSVFDDEGENQQFSIEVFKVSSARYRCVLHSQC